MDVSVSLSGVSSTTALGLVTKRVEERFAFDTATDTNGTTLASHTPEIGGSPVLHSSFTDTISIQSNRVGKDSGSGSTAYYYPATPPRLDYTIEADIVDIGNVNRAAGIAGWIDTAGDHMIAVRRQNSTTWQFLTIISGTATGVSMTTGANSVATTFSAGVSTKLKLVRSASNAFEWFIDDVSQGTATISDSHFQSAGKVGYRSSNNHSGTGYHIDNFSAYALVSPDITLALTGVSTTCSVGSVTAAVTPTAPSALNLTALSSHEVMLVWTDNANNETSFRIERKTGAGGTYAEIGTTTKNVIVFYDTTAAANATYFYRVRARNGSGDSAYLTEQSITTPVAGSTVTLMTANLQHGQGTDNSFNYQRQVDAMAGADIVCVQERSTSETGWNTPMSNAGLTQAIFKAHTGSAGDGNAIWVSSAVTVLQTYTFDMVQTSNNPTSGSPTLGWDNSTDVRRSLCAIKAQVGSKQFYVVSLHLVAASGEDSNNTNFSVQRVDQINSALGWAASTLTGGLPIIWLGDFNTPINYPRAPERSFTADASTDVITSTAHGFPDGMAVALRNSGGAVPGGLAAGDSLYALAPVYYVRDATTNTFKLSATRGGAAIDLTSNGTGSNFVSATQWSLFLEAGYDDQWQEALLASRASAPHGDRDANGTDDMPLHLQLTRSHDTRRIDYCMRDHASAALTLRYYTVPDQRAQCSTALSGNTCSDVAVLTGTPDDMGVRPSDHNFQKVVFDISPDVTLQLTGVSITSAVGTVVQAHDLPLSGSQTATATGTVGVDRSAAVTGTTTTTAVGTVTVTSGDIQVALAGVESVPGVGSVGVERSNLVSGVVATSILGTITTDQFIALSGHSVSTTLGNVAVTVDVSLNGASTIGQTGSVVAESDTSITLQLAGVTASCSVGSVTLQTDISASGLESVVSLGSVGLSKSGSAALTGIQTSMQIGSLTLDNSPALTGVECVPELGAVFPTYGVSLTTVSATGEPGSLSVSVDRSALGVSTAMQLGSITTAFTLSPGKTTKLKPESRTVIIPAESRIITL